MNWKKWNNQFSLTVPVTKEEIEEGQSFLTRRILKALWYDYGIEIHPSSRVKLVVKDTIKDFGVYHAMVGLDSAQLFGFALWIVNAGDK